jgi:hypothetical protein
MRRIQILFLLLMPLIACGGLRAQDNPGNTVTAPAQIRPTANATTIPVHRFWDTENICLFAGVGGARMMDYASTRHFRNQGDNEWLLTNSIVDNRPLFVGIELAGTAVSIGVSYALHRTGHHSLERWVSIAHIGVGVGGSIHNYSLKPAPGFMPSVASGTNLGSLR